MESDSLADGSQISATPPQPSLKSALLSSIKSRTKTRASAVGALNSRIILNPKSGNKSSKSHKIPDLEKPLQQNPLQTPISPTMPFQIRNLSHENTSPSYISSTSVDIISSGGRCASKFKSFSKIQKENLNFEPNESGRSLVINSVKGVKKHPNSIGASISASSSLLPVKKVKSVREGNFVKLNINGYGRKKFTSKGKQKKFGSASIQGRRFTKRSKKRQRVVGDGEVEESGLCDEDSSILEIKQSSEKLSFDGDLIQQAVMRVRDEASIENLQSLLKLTHGFDSFRDGQLEAIKTLLSGKSAMLVLSTGAGKSLCYQLPAIVLPGVTLVVSPLVALMIDQLKQLPPAIPGGLLSSSQTPEEASSTLKLLQSGAMKVLFISPERFLNTEFVSLLSTTLISLVVIDEAHCISEWSHNFRPSYMRLRASFFHAKLHAECILAMTATATSKTLHDIMHALEIPAAQLIHVANMRENLQLFVSMSGNRMKDLMALLKSSPYKDVKSIIIYCKFQSETDIISKYLCDNNISAKSYHSAIPAKNRSHIQEMFCSNKIRVVVATVAFGMGLDKRDVRAVIHYSLPESLEEYVQEIGRAGRDGEFSYCHLFFDDLTYFKMRSLMHSDGIDEYTVNKFLSQVFSSSRSSSSEICSIVKESASRKFDIKEEVMLTILTQLELGEVQYLNLLPQINVTCALNFHLTSPAQFANGDIVVAAILKKSEVKDGQYLFDIPSLANSLNLPAIDLSNHLQSLKLKGEITYELKDQAFCYSIVNTPNDICSLAAKITKWLTEVEICKVRKIDTVFDAAVSALKECNKLEGCHDYQHTACLHRKVFEYFNRDDDADVPRRTGQSSPFLRADIKVFLQSNSQAKFTPRAIARIMHGLASPGFPSAIWSRTHFWGRYMHIDFKEVMEAAKVELVNFVGHGRA